MNKYFLMTLVILGLFFSVNAYPSNCNDAISCFRSGMVQEKNNNIDGAIEDYNKSCNMEHMGSCTLAGNLYYDKEEYNQAKPFYTKACYNEVDKVAIAAGCLGLGNIIYKDFDFYHEDDRKLEEYYKELMNPTYKRDLSAKEKSLPLFERGCNAKAPAPFSNDVCGMYHFVKGYTSKQREQADSLCNNGDNTICMRLFITYKQGRGVPMDMEKSLKYVEKSCALGRESSCEYVKLEKARSIEARKRSLEIEEARLHTRWYYNDWDCLVSNNGRPCTYSSTVDGYVQ